MIASESDWLRGCAPEILFDYVRARLTPRQQRLFAAACCRRLWHLLPAAGRALVKRAERTADEGAALPATAAVDERRLRTAADYALAAALCCAAPAAAWAATRAARCADHAMLFSSQPWNQADRERERAAQSSLLRDVAGNPFCSVTIAPDWRTPNVLLLAQAIYEQRDFAALPILADALHDAGCDHSEILWHCEKPCHARGCWLLDGLLAKQGANEVAPHPGCRVRW